MSQLNHAQEVCRDESHVATTTLASTPGCQGEEGDVTTQDQGVAGDETTTRGEHSGGGGGARGLATTAQQQRRRGTQRGGPVVVRITRVHLMLRWGITGLTFLCLLLFERLATPYCRSFNWTDESINKAHKPDTFPSSSLILFTAAPAFISLILCYVAPVFPKIQWWEFHEMSYAMLLCATLNAVMTDPAKFYAGRLRPDFIDRLQIAGYNSTTSALIDTDYCAVSDGIVRAGRLSFPSGHSSTAFSSMVLTTLILINRFRVFHQPEWRVLYFIVAAFPLTFAFTVAISRTRDDRHHFSDILGGSVIGLMAAILSFRLVFSYDKERLMFIPTLFVRSNGHGTTSSRRTVGGGGAGSYTAQGDGNDEEDDELPPVVLEEMPVIA